MACWEGKKYKLDTSDNFDEYMKELGVGLILRKLGNTVSATLDLVKNGDVYTLSTRSTVKNNTINFKLDEEFDEETIDGRKCRSIIRAEGDSKFIHEQRGEKTAVIILEFTATQLTTTCTVNNVKSVRVYKAL